MTDANSLSLNDGIYNGLMLAIKCRSLFALARQQAQALGKAELEKGQ